MIDDERAQLDDLPGSAATPHSPRLERPPWWVQQPHISTQYCIVCYVFQRTTSAKMKRFSTLM